MVTKTRIVLFALVIPLVIASCRGNRQTSSSTPSEAPDIHEYLRKPGKITYVRYTTYTPPWPTRTEAWIDWDGNRIRSWNVQWTDSPTNPSVCTSIRTGDVWYPCLPSLLKMGSNDSWANAFWPQIPLRATSSELSIRRPSRGSGDGTAQPEAAPIRLQGDPRASREPQGDAQAVVNSWEIAPGFDEMCQDEQAGPANFEYTSTEDGSPISEFITVECGGERHDLLGVLYHEIRFLEASDLPSDFFDVTSTRASIIGSEMSSAAAQFGSVFWLGEQVGEWTLGTVEHDADSASVEYSRGNVDDPDVIRIWTRTPHIGRVCDDAQPIPDDPFSGSICKRDLGEYGIVWNPYGFDVWMETESYPPRLSREDLLALGARLQQFDKKASGSLLTSDQVANLVADSLELVCPSMRRQIRDARQSADFEFNRETGEWTGILGSFGEYVVPDSKPVAIPAGRRKEVDSTLSHNAAQFADCTRGEQPPPREGDDEFGVKFVSKDESGFVFQITGVDSKAEAALSMCMLVDHGSCGLTDPGGASVGSGAVAIDPVRTKVFRIHIGLSADELSRTGEWNFVLDLGGGRKAHATFEVP